MAILYKSTVEASLQDLENYYNELRNIVQGNEVEAKVARHYLSRQEMERSIQLVTINEEKLLNAISHFRVSVDALKRLKTRGLKVRTGSGDWPDGI